MKMREAREKYTKLQPARGAALLGWSFRGGEPAKHEALYPSLDVAMHTASILATDPRCHDLWIYDGRRLYDHATLTGGR